MHVLPGSDANPVPRDDSLRQSEERFRKAFDYAAIGMALVGTDGRWLRVNRAICEIVGYSEQELLALTFQEITHPEDLDADLAFVRKMLSGEIRFYHMEKRYFHKDGHIVQILLSVSLVHDTDGSPLYFISQIQDITRRKEVERERETLILQLQETLAKVRTLQDLLPICAWCRQVRNDRGYWENLEAHIGENLDVSFSHGICPDCVAQHFPVAARGTKASPT